MWPTTARPCRTPGRKTTSSAPVDVAVKDDYFVQFGTECINTTMAYVGTMALFEKAGFVKASDTDSVLNGFPRVLMRLDLR